MSLSASLVRRFSARLAVCALACAGARAAQAAPDLSWLDREAINAGQIEQRLENLGAVTRVRTAIRIDAPAEAIWDVLVACEMAPEIVPKVRSCESLETVDGGRAELFAQTVKPAFFLPAFEHVFRFDYEPYRRITISRVSGPLNRFEGYWWLEAAADGSVLLYYDLTIDPGIPVPRLFVRSSLRSDLPELVASVRELAEAEAASP